MRRPRVRITPVVAALVLAAFATPESPALEHEKGKFRLAWDNTLTYGLRSRVEGRDPDIVGLANGGTAYSVNADDGNLNYDTGIVAHSLLWTSELEIAWGRFGGFFRARGFYDDENENGARGKEPLSNSALDRVGTTLDLLDAYAWARFPVGGGGGEVRAGRQVINWGESTFIQGGLNAFNAVDLAALRVPGSELRDYLLPQGFVWGSVDLTPSVSLEAFWQYEWEKTEVDPSGTYFSTSDPVGAGGGRVVLGFGSIPDDLPFGPLPPPIGPVGAVVPRRPDVEADDTGQFGLAVRWLVPGTGGTETGFYFARYHSRVPVFNTHTGTLAGLLGGDYAGSSSYFLSYPEDIDLYGVSFNTQAGTSGVAIQGEISHRRDAPLQIDDVELIYALLSALALVEDPAAPGLGTLLANTNQVGAFGFGEVVPGSIRRDVTQVQATATRVWSRFLGADQAVLLGEAGMTYVHDLPGKGDLRLDGPGTFVGGNPVHEFAGVQPATEDGEHFADSTSWGYRVAGRLEYFRAIGAVNLIPRFYWAHDVAGVSPGPGGSFLDGRKTFTVGLAASFQNRWSGEVTYTRYSGGGRYNLLGDRDFVTLDVTYAF